MVTALEPYKVLQRLKVTEDGGMTLPPEVRDVLGVEPGAELMLLETAEGVLVTTRKRLVNWALDNIGAELRKQGVTLEELMESGEEIRQELYEEMYGSRPST